MMYQILIVDDEKAERDVIHFLLNKYNFPFQIKEAANGKEALDVLKKSSVDLLITDVKMPFIDGIELVTCVRKLFPKIEIIFFSGHDDFSYVKKALILGADNYILKPVKPSEFKETMEKVSENLQTYKTEQEDKKFNEEFIKKHILYRIINQTPIEMLEKEHAYLNFSFLNDYNRMLLIHSDQSFWNTLSERENLQFDEEISKIIPNTTYDLIHLNPSQVILLFKDNPNKLISYRQLGENIHQQLYKVYGINCFFSVSEEMKTKDSIFQTYNQLDQYLDDRFFHPHTYVYPIDSITTTTRSFMAEDEALIINIENAIQQMDTNKLKEQINQLIHKHEKHMGTSHVYIRFLFSKLFQNLAKVLPSYQSEKINKEIECLYTYTHFKDIKHSITKITQQVVQKLNEEKNSSNNNIRIVQQYIHDHIDVDLSLELLAEKVYLSPGYLSDRFRQETGFGINKYIKNVRMAKTKELLRDTNRKVNDISKAVGYNSVSYFIKNFREHYGVSPKKYREMNKTEDGME
ncbi:response regulator transcription factor [Gracilibacillus phocaeensis]|uniref:response regulator transcription factor n=1 Tax=Gracilibacillus phocaeensis TaxID=2042304 RepID=UPI0010317AA7|nr:response regulator [Gracilibacillus phocaeensis]